MQEKTCLTSEMDAQSETKCDEPRTRSCRISEENVARNVALDIGGVPAIKYLGGGGSVGLQNQPQDRDVLSNKHTAAQKPRYRFDATGHMHTLDGRPLVGTSTVCSEALPKHGLTWWSAELAAIECLAWAASLVDPQEIWGLSGIRSEYEAMAKLTGKDKKNARDRLQRKYPVFKKARYAHREAKESKAAPGTDMHASLETYVLACIESGGDPIDSDFWGDESAPVLAFANWSCSNVAEFLWSEAHCYSEILWTGGICDCGAILKDGTLAVIDFKSSQEAFFGYWVQAGGYALAIQENGLFTATGAPVSVGSVKADTLIIWPFGGDVGPVMERDVPFWQDQFQAAVTTYKGIQKFEKGKY